jgi:arginyl-tRNA synthetase
MLKNDVALLLGAAIARIETAGLLPAAAVHVERTRDPAHGDFASNVAMTLAKAARRKPRAIAEALVAALPATDIVDRVEIAGPGFINFHLKPAAFEAAIREILEAGPDYGHDRSGERGPILIEFVSANPTGPMHVGHGRGAAYGDSLANILAVSGYRVHREYYINDAGRQADILAVSVWLRYLELCGEHLGFPQRAYPGDYIRETAVALFTEHGRAFCHEAAAVFRDIPDDPIAAPGADHDERERIKGLQEDRADALILRARQLLGDGYGVIQRRALADQLAVIRATLTDFGVTFDRWCSERDLVTSGVATAAMERLRAAGHVYEDGGALWLRTSAFGDEKDRVLIKADGSATYFANDIAYHIDKLDRGHPRLLDVWGADHHGYIGRVRAAITALTGRQDALSVQLVQFVTLASGRMGKRSGNFVTFRELIAETGRDATRFFYLLRSHDQHLEFNIDLARARSNDNPVYYVQYAHARIQSVLRQLADKGLTHDMASGNASLARLTEPHERELMGRLSRYPEVVEVAAVNYEPHHLAHYLIELANDFHGYYNAHKFIGASDELRDARLNLCLATRQVIRNGLGLLGVSAPETM